LFGSNYGDEQAAKFRTLISPLSADVRQIQMSERWLWNDEESVILSDAPEECCV